MNRLPVYLLMIFSFLVIPEGIAQKLTGKKMERLFTGSALLQEHFVGFMLQDEKGKIIYSQNEDRTAVCRR